MKVEKYYPSISNRLLLKNGIVIPAPYFKKYSSRLFNHENLKFWFDAGFQYVHPTSKSSLLESNEPDVFQKISFEEIEKESLLRDLIPLWRPVFKDEIESIYDIKIDIKVKEKTFNLGTLIKEKQAIEIHIMYAEPLLGQYVKKDHYDRGMDRHIYHIDISLIDSLKMEIAYYDLSKFGETRYLDIAEKKIYSLDLKNPDMEIYKIMNEYGMLEIDWED